MQEGVQPKIAECLNGPGEDKTKGKNQCDTIMRATKANQSVGGIAEAKQRTAYFQIEIGVWGTRGMRITRIEDYDEIQGYQQSV